MSLEKDLARARALLSFKRVGFEYEELPADPAPEALGALAGFQIRSSDPEAQALVYVFAEWPDKDEVLKHLPAYQTDDPDVHVRSVNNGPLFFVGMARVTPEDRRGKRRVNAMLSAFAGDER